MICKNCGQSIPDYDEVCIYCGAKNDFNKELAEEFEKVNSNDDDKTEQLVADDNTDQPVENIIPEAEIDQLVKSVRKNGIASFLIALIVPLAVLLTLIIPFLGALLTIGMLSLGGGVVCGIVAIVFGGASISAYNKLKKTNYDMDKVDGVGLAVGGIVFASCEIIIAFIRFLNS